MLLKLSLPLRLALSALLNSLLIYGMNTYVPAYVIVFGGLGAYVIIGSLLTLLNFFVRPLLNLVSLPLKLLFTLAAIIIVNALFLWLTERITLTMDPAIIALTITGGLTGWLTVSSMLGVANWLMKLIL